MRYDEMGPTEGFAGPVFRHFHIHGVELSVVRGWRKKHFPEAQAYMHIVGTGILEQDTLCVIGSNERVREFELTLMSDACAAELWENTKFLDTPDEEGTDERSEQKRRLLSIFDKEPPTATLWKELEDWEIGCKGKRWFVECLLPKDVLMPLVDDLTANSSQEIDVDITWLGALVDHPPRPPRISCCLGSCQVTVRNKPRMVKRLCG